MECCESCVATTPAKTRVRVRFKLEFDGTGFCGWQLQSEVQEQTKKSIQGCLESAISQILSRPEERFIVQGCGRTDAGVHAKEFYAHADFPEQYGTADKLEKIRHGLNAVLPDGIVVLAIETAPDFHALEDVIEKTYEYRILIRRSKPTLQRGQVYWISSSLDQWNLSAMRQAALKLQGTHDFESFASAHTTALTTVRTIHEIKIEIREFDLLVFSFRGDGFLKQMCRTLAGTLIEIGKNQRSLESIDALLAKKSARTEAGFCASPEGLFLVSVVYES